MGVQNEQRPAGGRTGVAVDPGEATVRGAVVEGPVLGTVSPSGDQQKRVKDLSGGERNRLHLRESC